mgnify:CR=1 FL=1
MRQKVIAFIIRNDTSGNSELLVHTFVADPSLSRRVPGGGIDPDETPEQAIYREL